MRRIKQHEKEEKKRRQEKKSFAFSHEFINMMSNKMKFRQKLINKRKEKEKIFQFCGGDPVYRRS